jgi:ParB-like chromosome segregation protein Spo0J
MEVKNISTDKLKPYENNPRINDVAVDSVAASIKEFGFKVPIVIDKAGVIVCGHTRWKAAKKLGVKTVPCVTADDLTPEQIKAFRIADNQTASLADWEIAMLDSEIKALEEMDFDIDLLGFKDGELEGLLDAFDVDEITPPELASGDKSPFRQMTFTVHDEQFEDIEAAIKKAKAEGGGESAVNENSNGNALAFICNKFFNA